MCCQRCVTCMNRGRYCMTRSLLMTQHRPRAFTARFRILPSSFWIPGKICNKRQITEIFCKNYLQPLNCFPQKKNYFPNIWFSQFNIGTFVVFAHSPETRSASVESDWHWSERGPPASQPQWHGTSKWLPHQSEMRNHTNINYHSN